MKKAKGILVCLLVLLLANTGLAKEWSHASGFAFDLPDNWDVKVDDEVLSASDPSGNLNLSFITVKNAKQLQAALNGAEERLKKDFQDLNFGDPVEDDNSNGVHITLVYGQGKIKGTPIDLTVSVFSKEGKFLIMFAALPPGKNDKYTAMLNKVCYSVR